MATTTTYVSQLLGAPVREPNGRVIGKVADLLVPADTDYPTVNALCVKPGRGGTSTTLPWSAVRIVDDGAIVLGSELADVLPVDRDDNTLSLAHQVMDRQIIDVNGVRVVRVNDLQLAPGEAGTYRVVGIDVSTAGLLRRLGIGGILGVFGYRPASRAIAWEDVEPVESGDVGVKLRVSHDDLARLRPADVAQIIAQLGQVHGSQVLEGLDDEAAADVLEEVDDELQVAIIRGLDAERAADILEEMDPDEAADILGDLSPEHAEDLLNRMEAPEAEDVRELLAYPDETAGGLMTTEFVSVPVECTAGEGIRHLRQQAAEMDQVPYVYVIDERGRLRGSLTLRELIVAEPDNPIREVMHEDLVVAHPEDLPEEVARLIAKYSLMALPVVDDGGHLRGIVTVDDAMDVILPDQWKARLPRLFRRR